MTKLLLRVALALCLLPGMASAFDTRARAAYVYDMTTGTVLLAKNPDEPLPPASMSKLMTVNMLFEALKDGRVKLTDTFNVSSHAARMARNEGSTMFLDERDHPTVEELIQGIVVLSGNDACVAVAEGLAGTEAKFAELMTKRGREIGLTNSHFSNSSGWPDPGQKMSVHDLATVAARLITEFPEYYGYFSEKEFAWDGRAPANRFNRNPLLSMNIGADGLKTGHTSEAGYGLVGSAVQGGRRLLVVVTGLDTERARAEEAQALFNWGFRQFVQKTLAKKGEVIVNAPVWMGDHARVGLVPAQDLDMLVPATDGDRISAKVVYDGPIDAPIQDGQKLATLVIDLDGMPQQHIPLVANQAIGEAGIANKLKTAAQVLFDRYVMTYITGNGGDDAQAEGAEAAG